MNLVPLIYRKTPNDSMCLNPKFRQGRHFSPWTMGMAKNGQILFDDTINFERSLLSFHKIIKSLIIGSIQVMAAERVPKPLTVGGL